MWILLLVLVGAAIYFLYYRSQHNKDILFGSSQGAESALDIARKRYARGEITREQFDDIRRDLER